MITGWNDELFTGEIFYSSENNKMNGYFVFTARSEYTTTNGSYSTVGVSGKFQNIPFQ